MQRAQIFYPSLGRFEVFREIFMEFRNIKFHRNHPMMHWDRRTDRGTLRG